MGLLKFYHKVRWGVQGPAVQSVVSLMSSLRAISLTILADSIYYILILFAEKMWVAFALTFFSAKSVSFDVNFNKSLTNDVVSFEQLGPGVQISQTQVVKWTCWNFYSKVKWEVRVVKYLWYIWYTRWKTAREGKLLRTSTPTYDNLYIFSLRPMRQWVDSLAQWLEHWIFIQTNHVRIPWQAGNFFPLCFIPILRLSCSKMRACH